MGGRSTEREVSLASGREVKKYLNPERYEVSVFDLSTDLALLVNQASDLDVVFPALHGALGEDGTVQGLLDLLSLPYVGSGVLASAMCMDKKVAKDIYRINGLPVARDFLVEKNQELSKAVSDVDKELGFPVVVKPVNQGSSVGLTIADNEQELAESLKEAFKFGGKALIEQYIKGRELTCAVIGNSEPRALPPIEISPGIGHEFFDYQAKYEPDQALEICPAPLSRVDFEKIRYLSVMAHQKLGCRGMSRSDFILSDDGIFYILETNTLPGFTSNSLLPKAAFAAGIDFPSLLDELVRLALEPN
jgi:D-alanine-D-alanine ligase